MAPTEGTLVFALHFLANCDGFVLFSCCHSTLALESVEDVFNDEEEAKSEERNSSLPQDSEPSSLPTLVFYHTIIHAAVT